MMKCKYLLLRVARCIWNVLLVFAYSSRLVLEHACVWRIVGGTLCQVDQQVSCPVKTVRFSPVEGRHPPF